MRIGIIYETTYPEFKGGVERWFSQLARGLSENSIKVVYLNSIGKITSEKNLNYEVLEYSKSAFHRTGERSSQNVISFAISVFKSLRKNDFEVLYLSAFPFLHIWAAKIIRTLFKKKYEIYVEWFELPSLKFWKDEFGSFLGVLGYLVQQKSVRMSDVNVSYLTSTTKQLSRIMRPTQETLELPGICMDEDFYPIPEVKVEKIDVCQIGRLTKDKQPILSLQAIKALRDSGWKGKFHLLGSGPLVRDVSSFVKNNKMGEYVTIHGDASEETRKEILSRSAVLLHPSKREGFGLAIVEAAAVGVPAILIQSENNKSTELGINPTLISHSNNAEELTSLLRHALEFKNQLSSECLLWNKQVRPRIRAVDSISMLSNHFNSR
jgi:glycosyltransferase involved in cell wall biosynthesis